MSGYRRWYPSFWDSRMRESFGEDHRRVEVWLWLVTSESSSSIGIFRPNMRKLATETYLGGAADALQVVKRIAEGHPDKLRFDPLSGYVWVVNAAQRQHGNLSTRDNRLKSGELKAEFVDAMKSPFWGEFLAAYFRLFEVMLSALGVDPYEVLGKPLASPSVALQDDMKALREPLKESDQGLAKDVRIPALPCPALPTPTQPASRTHAHTNPSQSELAAGGMASWLDMELDDRAKVLTLKSVSEIPPGVEERVAEIQGAVQRVIAHYCSRCPGAVKGRNLTYAVARAVSALADDSELGVAEAERRLIVMLNWFERGNGRRYTNGDPRSGQDWFGDSVQVFGGKSGMVSVNGVSRETATILASNLTQALEWEAANIRRNTPARREEHEPCGDPPMSMEESLRRLAEFRELQARRARGEVAA